MKLINLNTQCGANYESLIEFVKDHSVDTNVFSFQEVFNNPVKMRSVLKNPRPNLYNELCEVLSEFNGYFVTPQEEDVGGLAIFVKKDIEVANHEHVVLYPIETVVTDRAHEDYFAMGKDLQYLECNHLDKKYKIFNFHGMYVFKGKGDTEKRIEQAHIVRSYFDKYNGPRIFCTDLNVEPGTKTLRILSEGNIDLNQQYNITTTRSVSKGRDEIVDYIIVSPEVKVNSYLVPFVEVSDHLPMILDFN